MTVTPRTIHQQYHSLKSKKRKYDNKVKKTKKLLSFKSWLALNTPRDKKLRMNDAKDKSSSIMLKMAKKAAKLRKD